MALKGTDDGLHFAIEFIALGKAIAVLTKFILETNNFDAAIAGPWPHPITWRRGR